MISILFIYSTPPNPCKGGVERMMDVLVRALVNKGYKVCFLIHSGIGAQGGYEYAAPIYFYPEGNIGNHERFIFYNSFLAEHKIDIVVNHCANFPSYKSYHIPQANGVKEISVIHSNPILNYEHLSSEELILKKNTTMGVIKLMGRAILYPQLKRKYLNSRLSHLRFVLNNSDKVVLLSNSYKKILNKHLKNFDDGKIVIIPNPLSFDVQSCPKKKQLLYVGRLEQGEKRPDRLLKIWEMLYKRFPDWEMIIVGDGKERERLEIQAMKLERISFVGFQSPEPYYRDASIFCMTSNFEGFPMVLPEAMAFGTIPFAFNSFAAVTDIINDEYTGILVKPFSIMEYANKLALLMNNEEMRIQMSENCRRNVIRFSLAGIVDLWEDLFHSL